MLRTRRMARPETTRRRERDDGAGPHRGGSGRQADRVLLRDARAVLRRVDVLLATALAIEDPALPAIAALRDGCDRLVTQLGWRAQTEQRRARDAVRRLR